MATKGELIGIGTAFCVAGDGVLTTARRVVDAANEVIASAAGGGRLAVVWSGNPPGDEQSILSMTVPSPMSAGTPTTVRLRAPHRCGAVDQ